MATAGEQQDAGPRPQRWPTSAILVVAACCVALVLLGLVNALGVSVAPAGYDPATGGTVADWFAAAATAIAVPVAMLVGIRQIGAQNQANHLWLRQQADERDARLRQEHADQAQAIDAIDVSIRVSNVADSTDLASPDEQAAVARWRDELVQRGWEPGSNGAAWQRGGVTRTNATHLSTERSPFLPDPWWVVVECRNGGPVTIVIERWTFTLDGESTQLSDPVEIRSGDMASRRFGPEAGLAASYRTEARASAAAAFLAIDLEGRDILGRQIHITRTGVDR